MAKIDRICRIVVAALVLWMAAVTMPAAAPKDEVAALQAKIEQLYRQGKYADAVPLTQRLLVIYENLRGAEDPNFVAALNNLAFLYYYQGRYTDAEPLFKRSLAIHEKAVGPDHPDVAKALHGLAALYKSQGRYADAEPLYRRALVIDEKALIGGSAPLLRVKTCATSG